MVDSNKYHLNHNDIARLIDEKYLHTNFDLTMPSKFNIPIFQSSGTRQEVEALQFPLMVISHTRDLDEVLEIGQTWIISLNYFLIIVSLDVSSLLKDFQCFQISFLSP